MDLKNLKIVPPEGMEWYQEGYKIALEAGQINEENRAFPNIKLLCSEDLY